MATNNTNTNNKVVSSLGRLQGALNKHNVSGFRPEDIFIRVRSRGEDGTMISYEPTLLQWVSDAVQYTRVGSKQKTVFDRLGQGELSLNISRRIAQSVFHPASVLTSSERQLLAQCIRPDVLLEFFADNPSGGLDVVKVDDSLAVSGRLEVLNLIANMVKAEGKRASDLLTRTVMTLASWQYNSDIQAKPGKSSSKMHFIHARDNAFHTLSEGLRSFLQTYYHSGMSEGEVYQGHIKAGWSQVFSTDEVSEDVKAS